MLKTNNGFRLSCSYGSKQTWEVTGEIYWTLQYCEMFDNLEEPLSQIASHLPRG